MLGIGLGLGYLFGFRIGVWVRDRGWDGFRGRIQVVVVVLDRVWVMDLGTGSETGLWIWVRAHVMVWIRV